MTIPSKPNELPSDEQLDSSTSQNLGSSSSTNPSVLATVQISGSSPTQNTSTNIHPPPSSSRPTLSETSLFLLSTSDSLHPLHHQSHPQHSDSQDTIQITPSSANIPTTPPAYTPSATLPPSYWSGERVGSRGNESDTESDFDDDEVTLGGVETGTHPNRPRREIDLAVYTQTRRTSTPTKPRRSRTQRWCRKHLYGLRRLHWYTLFFVNWDIVSTHIKLPAY
ncbi:hypothetical protein BCR33DRAFT_720409 [Rhizoclosmatium globosum]|uniref:Uncharacterized protein n=1 Tax=Rhizoclosmatium globosum TaxID=329046 RepID=A0A1Y2BYN4_9FUNG|nr:hypothetical protein BCR33DRAFT_720409 [Rhizoclosmatium globosum]|eukprot:ORY39175.1 hypothetical protein BCR33DRAFT_720409 [Rhizoclosmatium globosum]